MKTDLRGGLSLLVFFIENAVENLFKFLPVGEQHMKFLQVLGVVAPRYPYFQITLRTVLLVEVLDSPLIVPGKHINLRTANRYTHEHDHGGDLHELYLKELYSDKAFHILWRWLDHNMEKWWD